MSSEMIIYYFSFFISIIGWNKIKMVILRAFLSFACYWEVTKILKCLKQKILVLLSNI